jgi:transposase-like protein
MNKLPLAKRAQILSMLCEGSSMRSIARVVGVSFNTIDKLLCFFADGAAKKWPLRGSLKLTVEIL